MAKGKGGATGRNSRRNGLRGKDRDGSRAPREQRSQQRGKAQQAAGKGNRPQRVPRGVIEGRRAVAEALDAHVPLRQAYIQAQATGQDAALATLAGRLDAAGVPIEEVPGTRLVQLSSHGAHQGIVVLTEPFSYATLGDVIRNAGTGDALVVVLDHVTDEGNFGAIVRSCEVVGASGVVIPKTRAASVGVGAYKTSAGAVLHIPIAQVTNVANAVEELKEAGFWVVAATEHAEQTAWEAELGGRIALVMGSEGDGISRLVRERCDLECRLPQRGRIESLNVAQATTVLAYEWARRTWGESDA